jgi:hypothetical protein
MQEKDLETLSFMVTGGSTVETMSNGCRVYMVDGQLHRLDGPAIENPDGTGHCYYKGSYIEEGLGLLYNVRLA